MPAQNRHLEDALLLRFLQSEVNAEERAEVQLWLSESTANQKYIDDLAKTWKGIEQPMPHVKVDTDAAWRKLQQRIELEEESAPVPKVITLKERYKGWLVAASVALLLGLAAVWQWGFSNAQIEKMAVNEVLEQSLVDGSVVTLNKQSKLTYVENFKGKERKVKLEGEAFFDVAKDAAKPFVIDAGIGQIKVLGTSFNVEAHADGDLRVFVESGRVELSLNNAIVDTNKLILTAGNTGVINLNTRKLYMEQTIFEDDLFWLNKKLVFKKTPLPKVLRVLAKNYNIQFADRYANLEQCALTASFQGEEIESILEVIALTFNLSFDISGSQVQLFSEDKDCGNG